MCWAMEGEDREALEKVAPVGMWRKLKPWGLEEGGEEEMRWSLPSSGVISPLQPCLNSTPLSR